jgi:hypothetical protein
METSGNGQVFSIQGAREREPSPQIVGGFKILYWRSTSRRLRAKLHMVSSLRHTHKKEHQQFHQAYSDDKRNPRSKAVVSLHYYPLGACNWISFALPKTVDSEDSMWTMNSCLITFLNIIKQSYCTSSFVG